MGHLQIDAAEAWKVHVHESSPLLLLARDTCMWETRIGILEDDKPCKEMMIFKLKEMDGSRQRF